MLLQRIAAVVLRLKEYAVLAAFLLASVGLMQVGDGTRVPGLHAVTVTVVGLLQSLGGMVPNPFALRRENELLAQLNAQLLLENARLRRALVENEQLRQLVELRGHVPYRLIFAEIIGLSVGQLSVFATLDKGASAGIQPGMPVLAGAGLLGRVHAVSSHFALVELLENRTMRVAVRLEASGAEGILSWEGPVGQFALHYIPASIPVQAGERVVTSSSSDRFPADLPVGIVQRVEREPTSPFHRIVVAPLVQYSQVRQVAVVDYLPNPERRQLEERFLAPRKAP